jgi:hypothetical protein
MTDFSTGPKNSFCAMRISCFTTAKTAGLIQWRAVIA